MAYYVYDIATGDVIGGYDTADQARPHIVTGRSMVYEDAVLRDWTFFDVVEGELRTDDARLAESIRTERDVRLRACDWTVLPDVTDASVPGTKEEWVTYRQALRDIPQQPTFPGHFDWPVQPTEV